MTAILSGAGKPFSGQYYSQLIGFTARPLAITVKCVWHPVDQPVVPE
jgi:hypothetical protein